MDSCLGLGISRSPFFSPSAPPHRGCYNSLPSLHAPYLFPPRVHLPSLPAGPSASRSSHGLSRPSSSSSSLPSRHSFSLLRHSELLSAAAVAAQLAATWQPEKRHPSPSSLVLPLLCRALESSTGHLTVGSHGFQDGPEKEGEASSSEVLDDVPRVANFVPEEGPHADSSSHSEVKESSSSESDGGWKSFQASQIDGDASMASAASPAAYAVDGVTMGAKEPVYQVLEVTASIEVRKIEVSRRQLLKTSGLRQRDVRRVDPSLWVTNSLPALLVRDNAILLNLGSLRAIATHESVLVFDHFSVGAQTFLETLLHRLRLDADASNSGAVVMPFELEVVESALISRTQRLENALLDVEPRVVTLLEQLPNRLTADALEELRLSKQALVELGSKAGSLRQMLLELLDHSADLRRITAMGHACRVRKNGEFQCETSTEKVAMEDEEQEVEMLLEYYLQRCDSCFGQAEKLLDSAKEMEDSLSVNLSSRRLEVSRLELLLQVGTFAAALGALVAGIFGMNLRSRLEEHVAAFWFTTFGIIFGGILLFMAMYLYLKRRRIL